MSSGTPVGSAEADAALRWDRSAALFVAASFASLAGATTLTTALGKQVFDISHSELDLGLLGLCEFAPALLLILVTGTIADRRSRKRVAAAALTGQAATCAALWWYVTTKPTAVGPIFLITISFGVARAFAAPASRALIADVAGPERLAWLIPRRSTIVQTSFIAGPVLGGTLYAVSPSLPYVIATALLLASSMFLLLLNVRVLKVESSTSPTSRVQETLEGLRFIRGHQLLLGAISLDLFAVLFGGAIALLPAIAEERLHVGAAGYGWLRAANGMGAAMVTLVLTRRPVRRRVGRVLLVAVAVFGVATIVLGATTVYVIAFVAVLVLSGADALSVYIRSTLVPLVTPVEKRGRVSAVEMVFIGATNELGGFESGVTGQLLGTQAAVMLGGAATVAVAATWWKRFPALRDVDGFPTSATSRGA